MTDEQEKHLARIQAEFYKRCNAKYRKGQAEHGGDLFSKTKLELNEMALEEAIDSVVYLLTQREHLIAYHESN